jgi:uncharacterized membrane protein YgcG
MSKTSRALFVLIVAGMTAVPARAVAPEIKDDAKFFSPEAIKKANKELREIARTYDRDLLIESYEHVPGDQTERVKSMSREDRAKFFHNWAADRADSAVVNGVYILICKQPSTLEIIITSKAKSAFDKESFEQLRNSLLVNFREKHYDNGLSEVVKAVRERFAAGK